MSAGVFLTGGTGFVGTQIARYLIQNTDSRVFVLARGSDKENADLRLKRAWWEFPVLYAQIGKRVELVFGDMTQQRFGLPQNSYQSLVKNTTHIIHCGAKTTPDSELNELRKINVTGTANTIEFAKDVNSDHGLGRFSYVSTAYVAGKRAGIIKENELTNRSGFCSNYEQSKYEGEILVDKIKHEFPVSVFRPSLVVGDSNTGYVKTFNTVYYLLKLYFFGKLRFVPVDSQFKVNMVPVDYVAKTIIQLTFDVKAAGLTFHLTAPEEKMATAHELVNFARTWAKKTMNLNIPKARFVSADGAVVQGYMQVKNLFQSSQKTRNAFKILSPYFSQKQQFSRKNTNQLTGEWDFDWQEMLPNLLEFAVYYCFFHRSERTVHEQILFRLTQNTKPVRYHEIKNGQIIDYDSETVRETMFSAAVAMKAMGVKKGDTVVVVGFNSLRYLVIDVALGLLGAVSSPIYYTSPVSEINKILTETKAKLFFVGTPKVLEQISSVTADIPVISFCSKQFNQKVSKRVISWEQFLAQAKGETVSSHAPVVFSDLATIRYTYGSTGESKGACLEHKSLRHVAEGLASSFPWKVRTVKASYLSYLPLNHVAEGINATYSPYFVPTELDIYFLEDFQELQSALKKAKPSVFFSIPRFYEKVWEQVLANPLGKQYCKATNSVKKSWLRKLLKFSLLKKAGLHKCSQFIVGAACTSEVLLQNFQDLGIEILNAYGLSEAPLVAMNQLGSNNIGTLGSPLRDTQICIDNDAGEILIKGPQVMRGYLNRENIKPFKDGWFATGDIGEVTGKGHLKIHGRKKNLVITSYGKKVPTDKIEATLKTIQAVKEAIIVGDNKPYCCAVFWVDEQKIKNKTLESEIKKINKNLEHPAQIKRWATLNHEVLKGNNSGQLKTNRQELLEQIEAVIETLYSSQNNSGGQVSENSK